MLALSRADVLELLTLRDCIDGVERAFRLHAEGKTLGPGVLGIHETYYRRQQANDSAKAELS